MSYNHTFSIGLGIAQTGLTLHAQLQAAGVNVGSSITTGFTEIGAGNYELLASIPGDFRGSIIIFNAANDVMTSGDINPPGDVLDLSVSGHSAGSVGAALARIGANTIELSSPVAEGGDINPLYVGDAYTSANGRALIFTNSSNTWPELTDFDAFFYAQDLVITAEITVATGAGKTITVELLAADTEQLEAKRGIYALKVIETADDTNVITLAEGRLNVKTAP